jgi:hypothetical protein
MRSNLSDTRLGRWPVPALLAWAAAWGGFKLFSFAGAPAALALAGATAVGVACSLWGNSWWRRLLIGGGFPLSLALVLTSQGSLAVPAWVWLAALTLVLLVYPLNAWRDAPFFPTPSGALSELAALAPLPMQALILDAGCGLGHGLRALRQAYPQAQWFGLEWSWLLRWLCALRCPWARVRRADIWSADWSAYHLVYLFQRPESMPRVVAKAAAELQPGAWMVSLEFAARELQPTTQYRSSSGRMVWLYRTPFTASIGE